MATVRMTPGWEQALARESHSPRRDAIRAVAHAARRICPIDTGALADTIEGEAERDSMDCRLSAGDQVVDYAAVVEVGGGPHKIRSHGPYPLRNAETGQVFGPEVNHPGTPAQPYLRPALETMRSYSR